ncbi:hypothetical protein ACVWYH_005102 [Bradyrhizobium sp. GM24.11]
MTDWTPVFVLPNIPLETEIGCDIAALAPACVFQPIVITDSRPS